MAGVGQTTYYKHGQSPHAESRLTLEAILNACADAGIAPEEIDGFSSYSNDRNDGPRMAAALGCRELRFSNMFWGGGGGGAAGLSTQPHPLLQAAGKPFALRQT